MQVAITSRHGSISSDTQEHITRKSEKLLTYFERVTAISVTVDFETEQLVKVEMLVDAEHKHNFVASETATEVLPAFDSCLHKMEQQIRKYKEKIQDHRRDPRTNEVVASELDDTTE